MCLFLNNCIYLKRIAWRIAIRAATQHKHTHTHTYIEQSKPVLTISFYDKITTTTTTNYRCSFSQLACFLSFIPFWHACYSFVYYHIVFSYFSSSRILQKSTHCPFMAENLVKSSDYKVGRGLEIVNFCRLKTFEIDYFELFLLRIHFFSTSSQIWDKIWFFVSPKKIKI